MLRREWQDWSQNILYIDPGLCFKTIEEINKKYPNAFANARKAAKKIVPIMDETASEFRQQSLEHLLYWLHIAFLAGTVAAQIEEKGITDDSSK